MSHRSIRWLAGAAIAVLVLALLPQSWRAAIIIMAAVLALAFRHGWLGVAMPALIRNRAASPSSRRRRIGTAEHG